MSSTNMPWPRRRRPSSRRLRLRPIGPISAIPEGKSERNRGSGYRVCRLPRVYHWLHARPCRLPRRIKLSVIDAHWMAVARGDEPADLVLSGGRVLSVFTREWLDVDVAITDGHVVGLGRYEGRGRLDVKGAYLVPGFIDAHMHIESSKLMVDEFARAVLAHGTTTVVADPHEIANVLGADGIHWLLDCVNDLPLDVYVMASSCVPASRFESPRRPFETGASERLLPRPALRVAAKAVHNRRHREPAAPPPRHRRSRDDELPRRYRRR